MEATFLVVYFLISLIFWFRVFLATMLDPQERVEADNLQICCWEPTQGQGAMSNPDEVRAYPKGVQLWHKTSNVKLNQDFGQCLPAQHYSARVEYLSWCWFGVLVLVQLSIKKQRSVSQPLPSQIARCQSLANIMAGEFRGRLMMDYGFALPVFLFDTLFFIPIISISWKIR